MNDVCFRFRSKLPVVSNLTAMNMWDGVCMFFIYASFIEFILVNYLARWVQDPEQQKKKKENAILDVSIMDVLTNQRPVFMSRDTVLTNKNHV